MAIEFSLIPKGLEKVPFKPDISFIQKFAGGDLGIADKIRQTVISQTLGKAPNLESAKKFIALNKIDIPDLDSYISNGKINIPFDKLNVKTSFELVGLKAIEKSTIKSMFETQKPYMEIIGLVSENLIQVEDIVARSLGLADSSLKPKFNPDAIGFKSKEILPEVNKIKNIGKSGSTSAGSNSSANANIDSAQNTPNNNGNNNNNGNTTYEIISTEYSTGEKKDGYTYETTYKDIVDGKIILDDTGDVEDVVIDNKPDYIAFGIYDSKGIDINAPDWLKNTTKYYGNFPRLHSYAYIWKRGDNETLVSAGTPDVNNYGSGWENTEEKVFGQVDIDKIKLYYIDYINKQVDPKKITQTLKDETKGKLNKLVDYNSLLSAVAEESIFTQYKTSNRFTLNTFGLIPNNVNFNSVDTYVDPQTDYDLKLIKIDSTLDIQYLDSDTTVPLSGKILRFVKSNLNIEFDDSGSFDINFKNVVKPQDANIDPLLNTNFKYQTPKYLAVNKINIDNLKAATIKVEIYKNDPPLNFVGFKHPISSSDKGYVEGEVRLDPITNKYRYLRRRPLTAENGSNSSNDNSSTDGPTVQDIVNAVTGKDENAEVVYKEDLITKGVYEIPYGDKKFKFEADNNGFIIKYYSYFGDIIIKENTKTNIIIDSNENTITQTFEDLSTGFIRVDSGDPLFGSIISRNQISNAQLTINTGYDNAASYPDGGIKQLYRYRTSYEDVETFYIVEGLVIKDIPVLDANTTAGTQPSTSSSGGGGGSKYYKKKDALAVVKPFIKMMANIFVKLIPKITDLLAIFADPIGFVTNPIKEKLGECFEFLSKEFLKEFNKIKSMAEDAEAAIKEAINSAIADASNKVAGATAKVSEETAKAKAKADKALAKVRKILDKAAVVKQYVHIDDFGKIRYLLDGAALIELFGIAFGLDLKNVDLTVIFKLPFNPNDLLNMFGANKNTLGAAQSAINNGNNNGSSNSAQSTFGGTYETIDIQYSTGSKLDNVNYKYIYLTEYSAELIKKADDLIKIGTPESLQDAMNHLLLAYSKDDNKFILDKIKDLLALLLKMTQPILAFILNLVTMPLKIIKGIIDYIKSFFEGIANVGELPSKIAEFMSFEWFKKFFTKDGILGLLGLTLDLAGFNQMLSTLKTLPLDAKIDLNKYIKVPFLPPFPEYPKDYMELIKKLPCKMINSILSLLEGIINGVIEFIFSLINLGALFPVPKIKLTFECSHDGDGSDDTMSIDDLIKALFNDNGTLNNTAFAYDIKQADGRSIKDLNREELADFIKNNQNTNFRFDF